MFGDEVLKATANLVSTEVRVTNFFGRWVAKSSFYFSGTTIAKAAMAAAGSKPDCKFGHSFRGQVTCSFGVAAWMLGDTGTKPCRTCRQGALRVEEGGHNLVTLQQG